MSGWVGPSARHTPDLPSPRRRAKTCSWGADGEDSGRPASKQFVESLRVKVQQLESEIEQFKQEQHQAQSPRNTPSRPSIALPELTEPLLSASSTSPTAESGQELPETTSQPSPHLHPFPALSNPILPPQLAPVEVPVVNLPPTGPVLRYQYIFHIDTTLSLDEQYPSHRASLLCQWNRHLPDLSPVQLSRFEHDTIVFRFFSYGASCSFGLLPDLFLAEFLECLAPETAQPHPIEGTHYYTPLLHGSLLAFGAGYSDSLEIRARETRQKFATHAKGWLDEEFDHPSPSLALSLALLSEYHSGIGERNTGHMYMGMAVRAARAYPTPSNSLAQNWHRWSTYIQECLMALEIHRPTELPTPRAPISCPIAIEPDSRPPLTDSLSELLNHADYFKHSARCFIQMCKLVLIATRMIDNAVYDKQIILDTHLQLEAWFNTLPEGVLIRQRSALTIPPVLALHITYWWFILHSHLPLAEHISITTSEPVKELSIKMCTRATEKLVQLLNTFDKQLGFRCFPRNLIKVYRLAPLLALD
ncbi:unnamed protein product [Rhizoctonia solani]|uniref:Transcription factor domain-containing protein n=1 Tax=Rhizoctonia solani TaxID=456999 RepID=A0A8H3DMG4_9AGAM|nr:unnamed protein product [Rhizoctonia solani]